VGHRAKKLVGDLHDPRGIADPRKIAPGDRLARLNSQPAAERIVLQHPIEGNCQPVGRYE
jgi:hypothetical protein